MRSEQARAGDGRETYFREDGDAADLTEVGAQDARIVTPRCSSRPSMRPRGETVELLSVHGPRPRLLRREI